MKTKLLFISISILGLISSCQKVIDVNLNEADPQVVIDAKYNATDEIVNIDLSYTSNFFSNEESAKIDAAIITLTDGNGVATIIPNIGNGNYRLESLTPVFNSNYKLDVAFNGTTFTAESFLNEVYALDSLSSIFAEESLFGEAGDVVYMNLTNTTAKTLYFRALPYLNDSLYYAPTDLFLFDNEFVGAGSVQVPFFSDRFQVGDTVDVELQSLNKATSNYYDELAIILSNQSAAPTNPTNNWSNKALGLFQTWGYSKKRIIID